MSDTVAYYDRLTRWTAVARVFGYGGGRGSLTVHRALSDPRADGRATATRLHDLLIESLPHLIRPRVLDAGCGLGGTMIDLASRIGGTYTGLTLSRNQAAIGERAVGRAGLTDAVRILVQSYDTPPAGPFDLIMAIESLAHSPDPRATVRRLAARLAPGGLLAVVDDMPDRSESWTVDRTGSVDESAVGDLATFKAGWRCPVLLSAGEYEALVTSIGLTPVVNRDLTAHVRPRTLTRIAQLERLNRAMHRALPTESWRAVMDSYRGGLALERLYLQRRMRYRLLIARAEGGPAPVAS